MEDDVDIYKSVLQPVIVEPIIEVSKKPRLESEDALGNFEEEEVLPIPNIMRKNQFWA
jgi:hypothetical protein